MNQRLRNARDKAGLNKKGLTLEQVADAAGISTRQYQRIEAGGNLPRVDVAIKIADALGVSVEVLFRGIGEPRKRRSTGE